jgi:PiT family inorganic phosphate transporter
LGAGAYVGWNIGANDTANCLGTSVGCGLISFRNAVILVAIFAILGALLQGQYVMKTIGKGIVTTDLSYLAVIIALICSGFFVTLATFYKIPTSTSQALMLKWILQSSSLLQKAGLFALLWLWRYRLA